jgi:endonuclease/exonuclease/phosphatase family metal-dependent hydrolase
LILAEALAIQQIAPAIQIFEASNLLTNNLNFISFFSRSCLWIDSGRMACVLLGNLRDKGGINMKLSHRTFSTCSLAIFLVGCAGKDESTTERVALGKADASGSCVSQEYCGKKSPGKCYCDDTCEKYNDCCEDKKTICEGQAPLVPVKKGDLRVATYNMEDVRTADLKDPENPRLRTLAATIQAIAPDVILVQEFTYDQPGDPGYASGDPEGQNGQRFADNFLSRSQRPGLPALSFHAFAPTINTGMSSGFDLDNDGHIVASPATSARGYGNDCWGYGEFPGQFGFAILVRSDISFDLSRLRTFQKFVWSSMPDASMPIDPKTSAPWYNSEEWTAFRLSSKNHVDLPLVLPSGQILHILASHPTPPVFDGKERRNKMRNHDEIRLIADYLDNVDYLIDDNGSNGGFPQGENFVIMGDLNADLDEGDSFGDPIGTYLMSNPKIDSSFTPKAQDKPLYNPPGLEPDDTNQIGVRIDYVLPSSTMSVAQGGVVHPLWQEAVETTDHYPVWLDLNLP